MCIIVDDFDFPGRRISRNGKWRAVFESGHRRTELSRLPGLNLRFGLFNILDGRECGEGYWHTHPLDHISNPKGFYFPLLVVRYGPQVKNTDVRSPFPPKDLEQGDSTVPSCVRGHRGMSQRNCSGSCRFLASVFRLRRWIWICWSKLRPWSGKYDSVGNTSRSRDLIYCRKRW
jgi:hypothetical protein